MTFLSFILFFCTTIRPNISVCIIFFYLYMTIRPKLGITLILKFIIFLIEPIFCLQYCLYILSTTIIPLYFVYYIHRSAAVIVSVLYPWLYKALALELIIISLIGLGRTVIVERFKKKNISLANIHITVDKIDCCTLVPSGTILFQKLIQNLANKLSNLLN